MESKSLPTILKEIRERAERATEGPWPFEASPYAYNHQTFVQIREKEKDAVVVSGYQAINNGKFIAHARADIPRLLAALERAVEQRDSATRCCYHEGAYTVKKKEYNTELSRILEGADE